MADTRWASKCFLLTVFRLSRKTTLHGIRTAAFLAPPDQRATAFARIDDALNLIRSHDPASYALVQREIRRILVLYGGGSPGAFVPGLSLIDLMLEYLIAPETSEVDIAGVFVHEATHGRLCRLGFPYNAANRARIERICVKTERNCGLRLPEGKTLVDQTEHWLAGDGEALASEYSDAGLRRRRLQAMRELGTPAWLRRLVD